MLRQEVNLYKSFQIEPKHRATLTWRRFWYTQLLAVLIFTAIYLVYLWHLHKTQLINAKQQQLLAAKQQAFMQRKKQFPAILFNPNIKESLKASQENLTEQQKIFAELTTHNLFSDVMLSLARHVTNGTWLTNITIKDSGRDIALKGHSLDIDSLQNYFNGLLNDRIYHGYALKITNVEQKGSPNMINFTMSLTKHNG